MLRISEGNINHGSASLVLQGRVIGPWVAELQRCCEQFLGKGYQLTLDLAEVSFADRQGVVVLRNLIDRETMLINCPLFLVEQLKGSGL